MNHLPTDEEDEDEIRLKKLLEEMVKDMSNTQSKQESLKRDHKRKHFKKFHEDAQRFTDLRYLAQHAN